MSSYQDAVKLVVAGATYRDALAECGLKSLSNLHRLCHQAGVGPRSRGYRPKPLSDRAIKAAALVRGGMTFRQAREITGLSLGAIHRAVHYQPPGSAA